MAREFHNRSIPVDVIVVDYHHWKHMGDWSFDTQYWPDVTAMVVVILVVVHVCGGCVCVWWLCMCMVVMYVCGGCVCVW